MNMRWKYLLTCLMLAMPAMLSAQGPRGGLFPWWEGPLVGGLDLTDAQRSEIRSVIREYRGKMFEVRGAVQKAEGDLEAVFNEDTVDQRRGAEAIDHLTKARADMTRSVSELSLRMRAVLTPQQWQELQQRQKEQIARIENAGRGPGSQRGGGRGRRGPKGGPSDVAKGLPPGAAPTQSQLSPPALTQQ
jgi:Spy/CpxP family protein refolding chaperone